MSVPAERPEHLVPTETDRGFAHMPELLGTYGDSVRAYESSGASQPCVWLAVRDSQGSSVAAHLAAETAWKLAEQLMALVENHYQGDARPTWARESAR